MNLTKSHQQLKDRATLNNLQHFGIELDWNDAFGAIHQGTKTGRISVPCISDRGSWARAPRRIQERFPETAFRQGIILCFPQHESNLTLCPLVKKWE